MTDILSAFPARPLHARPPGQRSGEIWAYLGFLMFAGILAASAIWIAPQVVTDWQIRDMAVAIRGGHLVSGKCDTKLFIDLCDATLTAPGPNGTITRETHILFASLQTGNFTARVVADPQHPQWLSTDLALDHFWDRVITLLTLWALTAAFLVGFILSRIKARRVGQSWRTLEMVPVPLAMVETTKDRAGTHWTVRDGTGTTARWTLPSKAKPFLLGPDGRILGLTSRGGANLFPLDADLKWVDLTSQERTAVLAARAAP